MELAIVFLNLIWVRALPTSIYNDGAAAASVMLDTDIEFFLNIELLGDVDTSTEETLLSNVGT